MKRALVIGATGFLGLNLVDELLAREVEVHATVRRRSLSLFLRRRPVRLHDASLEEPASLAAAMREVDVVFLAAGHYPRYSLDRSATLRTGVAGIRSACEALEAGGRPRLVYFSSIASLSRVRDRPAREHDVERRIPAHSVYRAVKHAMERELERQARRRRLDAVTLLPGGCIGPWDVRLGTGSFLVGLATGRLTWYVDGLVHLVHVRDVARAAIAAATSAPAGARYCLGGHAIQIGELIDLCVDRYGGRRPATRLDPVQARARADADEREAAPHRRRVAIPREMVDIVLWGQPVSSDHAGRELGFAPVPLVAALDDARAWLARYGYLPEDQAHAS